MASQLHLHPDRLFSSNPVERDIARTLYNEVKDLPIVSPHGHTDPAWFALNEPFANPTDLLIKPDHYVYRMLYSQGISLDELGIWRKDGSCADVDPREVWRVFAKHFYLFKGTPSSFWLNYVFVHTFGIEVKLEESTADHYYDIIDSALKRPEFLPRALFEQYNIEVIATTECATDELTYHQQILDSGWKGKVISAFRPDAVIDPEHEKFTAKLAKLGALTDLDCTDYDNYLAALRQRRAFFKTMGVTSTDHGHPTAATADLSHGEAKTLFAKVQSSHFTADEAELFRAHMLTVMAEMSIEDGLVMQIHPGAYRNHNKSVFEVYGRDKGADVPSPTEYIQALKPLLDKFGNNPNLNIILFTLDETVYSRELAPLAGHYPCLKLGPSWWFHDSPEGMIRFRRQTTETAGFYNTVGFNDDTRAFLSIPARHDLARRMDCVYLAELVARHYIDMDEAHGLAKDLAYNLAKRAYNL
ncbi:uronate isomerase [Alteromonas sp. KUL156]|nr:uronate isomerase [Alteromonas sp. KUL154]GFD98943.1 uronate isomerase [Alteromonas sp. KUL156]